VEPTGSSGRYGGRSAGLCRRSLWLQSASEAPALAVVNSDEQSRASSDLKYRDERSKLGCARELPLRRARSSSGATGREGGWRYNVERSSRLPSLLALRMRRGGLGPARRAGLFALESATERDWQLLGGSAGAVDRCSRGAVSEDVGCHAADVCGYADGNVRVDLIVAQHVCDRHVHESACDDGGGLHGRSSNANAD
jgi:hypothetical protein